MTGGSCCGGPSPTGACAGVGKLLPSKRVSANPSLSASATCDTHMDGGIYAAIPAPVHRLPTALIRSHFQNGCAK